MTPPVAYHEGAFPPKTLDWERLVPLLGPATAAIARYQGILEGVPNPDVLLSPLMTQEAVLSSRIEGTQATLGEVLEYEATAGRGGESAEKTADITEVLNYRAAIWHALSELKSLPLSVRLVRSAHHVLMQGVRGQEKTPGEFRRIPVWLGKPGSTIEAARFVPLTAGGIPEAMSRWERYVHSRQPDVLVQLAVMHAEFEAIHPFLDGNGRIGRLLIPLFLVTKGVMDRPNFYISGFFEERRDEYYERLLAVSRDGDWTGWCAWFLTAVREQAERNGRQARSILDLYRAEKERVVSETRSQHAIRALDWIFQRPIFSGSDFLAGATVPAPTARRILGVLRKSGVLTELRPASGRRPAILAFPGLLNIAEGREVL